MRTSSTILHLNAKIVSTVVRVLALSHRHQLAHPAVLNRILHLITSRHFRIRVGFQRAPLFR
jgi:hypothetical protein